MGLGALADDEPEPERTEKFAEAVQCWNLLGGFNLAHLPLVDTFWPLADPEVTFWLLVDIRDAVNEAYK